MEQMNWLITGGCGFIGRNLIKYLVESEKDVCLRVIDDFSVGQPGDLEYTNFPYDVVDMENITWDSNRTVVVKGDIQDELLAISASKGADVIVHLAANTGVGPSVENPKMDCLVNVLGTFNYLNAARTNNVNRFIFASSGAPIGECEPPIHEELACHPVSPYGASKLAGEAYCSAFYHSFGVHTVGLRFGNVYGPGSSHKESVVAKFIKRAVDGKPLEIYGDGGQTRDFIFIKDLIRAVIKASEVLSIGGEVFQIATNRETTVLELTHAIVAALKTKGFEMIKILHGDKRKGDVSRNFSDTSKAANILSWKSNVSLLDGLGETIDWFLSIDDK